MLEKGKGPVVDKLYTIQIIEVDLQLLIRILANTKNKLSIETNKRVLKYNYRLRTNYSIKNAILEKRLWYDNSLLQGKTIIHNMTDLKAYYDWQLLEVGYIVEESIGIEKKLIQLIAKVLLIIEYHICTSFGVSTEFYSRTNNK